MDSIKRSNQFNREKLLHSKWTAVVIKKKQKHFLVTKLIRDEVHQKVVACILQAVIDNEEYQLDCQVLKNGECWQQGWK